MAVNISEEIEMTEEMEMLSELIRQDQFEPADRESMDFLGNDGEEITGQEKTGKKKGQEEPGQGKKTHDVRIIYLMNDAAEAFLIFRGCRKTGNFIPEYEGRLEAGLDRTKDGYVLVLYQGDSVLTLFFDSLDKEVNLYNYARLGHFWKEGYEYLRQLEYHLAIAHDKWEYLGEKACSKEERELIALAEFPPLNYCSYPAAAPEYVIPTWPEWEVSEEALQEAMKTAEECRDRGLGRMIAFYGRHPGRITAKLLARQMHRKAHEAYVDLLMDKVRQAASAYPDRAFQETADPKQEAAVWKRKEELEKAGKKVSVFYEEPFSLSRDSIEFQIHLMIWKKKWGDRVVEIETFPVNGCPRQTKTGAV